MRSWISEWLVRIFTFLHSQAQADPLQVRALLRLEQGLVVLSRISKWMDSQSYVSWNQLSNFLLRVLPHFSLLVLGCQWSSFCFLFRLLQSRQPLWSRLDLLSLLRKAKQLARTQVVFGDQAPHQMIHPREALHKTWLMHCLLLILLQLQFSLSSSFLWLGHQSTTVSRWLSFHQERQRLNVSRYDMVLNSF